MKKQNKRNQFTRITLALLLILSMLGNTLILPAVAQETVVPADEPTSSETPTPDEADAASTPTLPDPIRLTAADIPEFISAAALTERGAVERMRSEETNMSSVIFRNSDGTRTMYMYGLPVKYTAADGTLRDKSINLVSVPIASVLLSNQPVAQTMAQLSTAQRTALQEELGVLDAERAANTLHILSTALTARGSSLSDMAYTTLDNDVYALFPTHLTEGMTLVFGEHSIRMTPATGMTMTTGGNVTKTTTASLSDTDVTERLLYPNVFGPGTAVQYTPTLTGIKEEILLSYNVGKNSFDFLLETDGLVLTEINGLFLLINPETEQQVGKLGEIIVFDSAGQIARGQMTAQTIKDGKIYGVTISVDQEFLASATYPVSIDPTVDLDPVEEDYEYGETVMIEDVSIYNNINVQGYTFIEWHQIGEVFDTGYKGQAAFRFPILYTPSELYGYSSLTADQIFSFTLHLKSTTNTTKANTLMVCQYVPPWPNTFKIFDTDYFGYFDFTDNDISVIDVPQDSSFCIDLTGFVKQWKDLQHGLINDYLGSAETGVLLWNDDDSGKIWLESVEYSTSIYVTMDYIYPTDTGDFYMNNQHTRKFLATGNSAEPLKTVAGTIDEIGNSITWTIQYEGDGKYSIHPYAQPELYLNSQGIFVTSKSEATEWTKSSIVGYGTVWKCEGNKVLGVNNSNVVVGPSSNFSVTQKTWRMIKSSNYVELENLDVYIDGVKYDKVSGFPKLEMTYGETAGFEIEYDDSCSFVSADDFEFWGASANGVNKSAVQIISSNENGALAKGLSYGDNILYVIHIPTHTIKTLQVHVKGCAEEGISYYPDHSFMKVDGITSHLLCKNCNFAITIADYYKYVYEAGDEYEDSWPFHVTYTTYDTKDEAVLANAYKLFRLTVPEDSTLPSYEYIAGIYKTTDNKYIVSNYKTEKKTGSVTVFPTYTGVPSYATLIGFVHTHPLTGSDEKFSMNDIINSYTLHKDMAYETLELEYDTLINNENIEVEVQFTEDYLIRPTSNSTYEVWKIDVYAQTTHEAYMNQRQVYPQD